MKTFLIKIKTWWTKFWTQPDLDYETYHYLEAKKHKRDIEKYWRDS